MQPEYQDLRERTCQVTIHKSAYKGVYRRTHFEDPITNAGISCDDVEALGPVGRNYNWHITFNSKEHAQQFARTRTVTMGDDVSLATVVLLGVKTRIEKVRIHGLPYFFPMDVVSRHLEQYGQVLEAGFDSLPEHMHECNLDRAGSLVRILTLKTEENLRDIPYEIELYDEEMGIDFLCKMSITGRRQKCYRCGRIGHTRKKCEAIICEECFQVGHSKKDCRKGKSLADMVANRTAEDYRNKSALNTADDEATTEARDGAQEGNNQTGVAGGDPAPNGNGGSTGVQASGGGTGGQASGQQKTVTSGKDGKASGVTNKAPNKTPKDKAESSPSSSGENTEVTEGHKENGAGQRTGKGDMSQSEVVQQIVQMVEIEKSNLEKKGLTKETVKKKTQTKLYTTVGKKVDVDPNVKETVDKRLAAAEASSAKRKKSEHEEDDEEVEEETVKGPKGPGKDPAKKLKTTGEERDSKPEPEPVKAPGGEKAGEVAMELEEGEIGEISDIGEEPRETDWAAIVESEQEKMAEEDQLDSDGSNNSLVIDIFGEDEEKKPKRAKDGGARANIKLKSKESELKPDPNPPPKPQRSMMNWLRGRTGAKK